jgi:hypothetical protein
MNANRSFLKSLVITLSLITPLVVISKAQAKYIFEWEDFGQEWYFLPGDDHLTIQRADPWVGHFTLPDSAVTNGYDYGNYHDVNLDLTQYLDFSLTGKLISGNNMDATTFHGGSLSTPQPNGSKDILLWSFTGDPISYEMENPSWMDTPLYLTIIDEDHWFYYEDMVFDEATNSMVPVYVSHDGIFVGHHIDDPVPEPATMLLLGTGIAGIVSIRLRKKKR